MTLIVHIYLPYYVLIDCCMPTCTCTHAKLSRTSFFLGQILNLKTSFFFWTEGVCPFCVQQCKLITCQICNKVVV
jgi:hypothetical protein